MESMAGAQMPFFFNVAIFDNPLLVLDCVHILEYYSWKRRIRGNRENCGCELDGPLTQALALTLEDNCTVFFGNLILRGTDTPSYETLLRKFGTATKISGEIAVIDTDFVDLSFFGNLQEVFVEYDLQATEFVEKFLRIENNEKLQRLGWNAL
ncbi:hypothetical protein OSTOST_24246, partial [Ostertagia ostertagi]